jgi:hypothetical protein
VPIEAEDATERLKPEGIGKAAEDLGRPEFAHHVGDDLARAQHHAREEPWCSLAGVEREGGGSGAVGHGAEN